ncbi:response regulator [Variovorax sp. N23]|uniref:response regulator n=1 Tax=Variovorax sp. N23 TaxID=2980555 RepID=UPI0021C8DCC5|nr:response regulator [Variovorax sp. N23]MCU4119033.1 response regulator [Variovorax sp. N23]
MAAYLRELGYRVSEMSSAQDAEAHIKQPLNQVDLVIADVAMPGVSGDAFASWLSIERPELPVILITGGQSDALVSSSAPVLTKPFAMSELARAILERLGRRYGS